MKLNQLRIFSSAARHLNLTNAAEELGMSQPAVSLQMKCLEEEFGSKFYHASNRGIELTPEGQTFVDAIRPILAELDRIERRFKWQNVSRKSHSLKVGGNHTLSATLLLEALIDFRKRHPNVQIAIETAISAVIEDYVANAKIDIGLINAPRHLSGCAYENYGRQETVAFVPPGHPLADRSMDLEALTREPLVARKESAYIKELIRRGFKPTLTLQFMAPDAVKSAVQKGLGVGLLFQSRIEPEIVKGDFRRIDVPELKKLTRESFIVYRDREPLSPIAEDFIEELRARRTLPEGSLPEKKQRRA